MKRARRRHDHERGASLVEFALILPVFVVMIFGMITGGIALSQQNSVKNAVREATRFGAVIQNFPDSTETNPAEITDLYDQVVNAATGDLSVDVPGREICVALIDESNKWWWALYTNSNTPIRGNEQALPSVNSACAEGFDSTVGADTQRIWVRAERKSEIDGIFFQVPVTLDSRSLSRYER